jgi:antitoxin MazE
MSKALIDGMPFGYTLDIRGGGTTITKVQKWGNSQGLRLRKPLLSNVAIHVGDAVNVTVRDGALVVMPLRRVRGGHDLRELVKRIPKDYKPTELNWGPPICRESGRWPCTSCGTEISSPSRSTRSRVTSSVAVCPPW